MTSTTRDTTTAESDAAPSRPARTWRSYLGLALRGVAMGASDIVPGVSGGTMAFILGIYEELIDAIREVGRPRFLKAVVSFDIRRASQMLNWPFLVAVASGIMAAILLLSQILETLLVNQPVYLWSFFFGLVVASIFVVAKRVPRWTLRLAVGAAGGAIIAYFVVGLVPAQTPNTPLFLFASGALAICAMVLPGISGAFILVLLGKYEYVLAAVNNRDVLTLALVAAGASIGIVTFAQLLGWLFKRYHDLTVAMLIGLMIGSLRKIWPWKNDVDWLRDAAGGLILDSEGHQIVIAQENYLPTVTQNGAAEIGVALLLALGAVALILTLDKLAESKETEHVSGA